MTPPPAALAAAATRSRDVAQDWYAGAEHRALVAHFDAVAAGDADAVVAAAVALLGDADWVTALLAPLVAVLAADPWFEPPLRVNRDPLRSGAILLDHPAVTLTAAVLSAERLRALPPPATLVVAGRITVARYVSAGGARLRRWRAPPLGPVVSAGAMGRCERDHDIPLADGQMVLHDGRCCAQLLDGATRDVVTLTATIRAGAAPVMREYDRATGDFRRMATTDEGAARAQVLLTLLRVAGAQDAEEVFEAATRDGAFFLRWSAMREWIAHDWRAVQSRLSEMAMYDPHPEVRATAAATLALLAERRAA